MNRPHCSHTILTRSRRSNRLKLGLAALLLLSWYTSAAGPQTATAGFRAACVKVDITPETPQWLLGFGERRSEGVHDRIYHRIVAMDRGRREFFLISSDLSRVSPSVYDEFCEKLKRETGIQASQLWWASTHTHGAPLVGPPGLTLLLNPERYQHELNTQYSAKVLRALEGGIKQAQSKLEPARLRIGVGTAEANVNRRAKGPDGQIVLGVNPDGPVDRQLGLLKLERLDGAPIALIANYAMHGTAVGSKNKLITADAAGVVSEYVEEKLGAPMLFLNGAAGNVAPIRSRPDFTGSPILEFKALLGDPILAAARFLAAPLPKIVLETEEVIVETPRKAGFGWTDDLGKYTRTARDGSNIVRLPLRFLSIGPNAVAWCAPVEMFSEIAMNVRKQSPYQYTFFFGYCNGSLLYLPTKQAIREGGYEPRTSPFTEQAEADVTLAAVNYLRGHR